MKSNFLFITFGIIFAIAYMFTDAAHAQVSNNNCYVLSKNLNYGSGHVIYNTDDAVKVRELQDYLAKEGFFNDEVSGYYGKKTKEAVMKYQKANKIQATGNFGPLTRKSMRDKYCKVSSASNSTSTIPYESNNPIAPNNCKVWYDGCNTCSRSTPGAPMACTMMACMDTIGSSVCKEYFKISSSTIATTTVTSKIIDCPDEKIINKMPVQCIKAPCDPIDNSYYIYKGARKELSDFDSSYVKNYCKVKEATVY